MSNELSNKRSFFGIIKAIDPPPLPPTLPLTPTLPLSPWQAVKKDTIAHGHSTPEMAGNFAQAVDAKRLVAEGEEGRERRRKEGGAYSRSETREALAREGRIREQ